MKRIIATTDGTERAGRAVSFAAQLARCFGAELTLVHVRTPETTSPLDPVRAQAEQAGAQLEIVDAEKPAEAIVETADALEADAIVIGNYGMSDRKEFLLGNIPNRVSHQANCSVLIIDTRDDKERKRSRRRRR